MAELTLALGVLALVLGIAKVSLEIILLTLKLRREGSKPADGDE